MCSFTPRLLSFSFVVRPRCLLLSLASAPSCPGPCRCAVPAPAPPSWFFLLFFFFVLFFCFAVFVFLPFFSAFPNPPSFSPSLLSPLPSSCLFCWSPAARLSLCSRCFSVLRLTVGCSLVVAAPPPFCVSRFLVLPLGALCFFFSYAALRPPSCLALVGGSRRPLPPSSPGCARRALCFLVLGRCAALPSGVLQCPVAVFCAACSAVVPRLAALWAAARCAVFVGAYVCVLCGVCWLLLRIVPCLWSCHPVGLFAVWSAVCFWSALPCAVLCCVSLGVVLRHAAARCAARCCAVVCCVVFFALVSCRCLFCRALWHCPLTWGPMLCSAVCSVPCVFCRGVLVRAVVRRCALCCLCPGVSCCAFPVLSALRGAVLWCAGALALCCSCGACYCWRLVLWCVAVYVLFPLVFRGAVLDLVAGCCLLVACFSFSVPVCPLGLLRCGLCGLLWCPASLCRVLWCFALALCCAVVLCCLFAVLFELVLPSSGLSCGAVLCCVVLLVVCAVFCPAASLVL